MLADLTHPAFMPLLGQPPGEVLDIVNTSQLQIGDVIHVTFPFLSRGFLIYGGAEDFTVFGFDPPTNQIGVRDESGKDLWLKTGSREDLLSKLAQQTSYSSVEIVRPGLVEQAPEATPGTPQINVGLKRALFEQAQPLLPAEYTYTPLSTRSALDLEPGDLLYDRSVGERRVWIVDEAEDPAYWALVLLASANPNDTNVGVSLLPKDRILNDWELAVRAESGGGALPWLAIAGGAALLVLLTA